MFTLVLKLIGDIITTRTLALASPPFGVIAVAVKVQVRVLQSV